METFQNKRKNPSLIYLKPKKNEITIEETDELECAIMTRIRQNLE